MAVATLSSTIKPYLGEMRQEECVLWEEIELKPVS